VRVPAAAAAAALLLSLTATACRERRPTAPRDVGGLDRKLSTFAWIEDGSLVALIVDTRAARYNDDAPYVPLEIAVANRGLKDLTLTRESFTLVDETGKRYGAVGPRELREGYEFLDLDRNRLAELAGIVDTKFATFTRYPSFLSPTRGLSPVRDIVMLPKFGYMVDFIYFPMPATGVVGKKLELQIAAPQLPPDNTPIFVKFMVL
jgi:hypothetical protein